MKWAELAIGMSALRTKRFTEEDVGLFARVSDDANPIHLNEDYASQTVFKRRIVHGLLVSGLISAVLGMQLPGEGSVYLSQELKFVKPVFLDDEVTATVIVCNLIERRMIAELETICTNARNEVVLKGKAMVKLYS